MSAVEEQFSRVVIAEKRFRFLTLVVLSLCFPVVILLTIGAFKRPDEPEWWLMAVLTAALAGYVCWRDVSGTGDWNRYSFLEFRDGSIKYQPSRELRRFGNSSAQAPFPEGARLEYQRESGDRYFTGDHGQFLQSSLWIVAPTGTKQKLFELTGAINARIMLLNLRQAGIPSRAVQIYNGQDGEHTETDITPEYAEAAKRRDSGLSVFLLGTSSMWLGVTAALFVHNSRYVIGIGVLGYVAVAAVQMLWCPFKRSGIVGLLMAIPSFAGGYAVAVVAVWYIFK